MPVVTMPDGTQVTMPDQPDPALLGRLQAFRTAQSAPKQAAAPQGDSALKQTLMAPVGAAEEFLKAGTGALASIPAGLAYAGSAVGKAFGADTNPDDVQNKVHQALTYQPQSNSGQAADQAFHDTYAPVGQAVAKAGDQVASDVGHAYGPFAESLLRAAPGAAQAASAVVPAGAGVVAGAGRWSAANAAADASRPAWADAGYRSASAHPIAAGAAGQTGTDALVLHNQQIGNVRLGSDAGVPRDSVVSHGSLIQGAQAPNAVYNRTAASLPTVPLSPTAEQGVRSAGVSDIVTHSPDAQAILDAQKARLLNGPQTGEQVVDNMRALRQEGYTRIGSGDVEQGNLGRAQLDMARALERHVQETLPPGSPVSMEQLADARTALAKNHAVRAAMNGSNVDLQAIARMNRADPGVLTGELKTAADFASDHPVVSTLANRKEVPPSFGNDVGQALNSARSADVIGRMLGATGVSSAARRVLVGDSAGAVAAARASLPGSNAARFAPLPPGQLQLQPPPGSAGVPPSQGSFFLPQGSGVSQVGPRHFDLGQGANPSPAPQAPTGDFAGVMSQGVGERPAGGPSMSFHGQPRGDALPFRFSPEVVGERPVQGGSPQLAETTDDYGNRLSLSKSNDPGASFNTLPEPQRPTLADRFAGALEEAPPNKGTVSRFGNVSPAAGSEGRVVSTSVGKQSIGDLLADLHAMVGNGVPEGFAAKAGPRTGPSKPWLVDAERPGRDNGLANLMEDIHGDDHSPFSNNASGQTDVSQEFANWQADRKAQGVTRHRYDPSTDEMVPMHSTNARDPSSVQGRPVFDRDAKGNYTPVDRGGLPLSAINGIIARMKGLGDRFASQ